MSSNVSRLCWKVQSLSCLHRLIWTSMPSREWLVNKPRISYFQWLLPSSGEDSHWVDISKNQRNFCLNVTTIIFFSLLLVLLLRRDYLKWLQSLLLQLLTGLKHIMYSRLSSWLTDWTFQVELTVFTGFRWEKMPGHFLGNLFA